MAPPKLPQRQELLAKRDPMRGAGGGSGSGSGNAFLEEGDYLASSQPPGGLWAI